MFKTKQEILDRCNKCVHGHIEAKKAIINLLYRCWLRREIAENGEGEYCNIAANNILLMAPSGTGKTYLVKTISDIMDINVISVDATQLAPASAEGLTMDRLKAQIRAQGDTYLNTVVFIDEIDKIAHAFDSTGKWHIRVQESLLTLIESSDINFKYISFIFAGAFTGIETKVTKKSTVGFTAQNDIVSDVEIDWAEQITTYGLIPELVGRLAGVLRLDQLTIKDYLSILNTHLLPNKSKELKSLGCRNLKVTHATKTEWADKAMKSGRGVRYMQQQLNILSQDLEFNCNYKTPDIVKNN